MFGIGTTELIVIFLILLLVVGGKKLPEVFKGLGKGINEFNKAKNGVKDAIDSELREANLKKEGESPADEAVDKDSKC